MRKLSVGVVDLVTKASTTSLYGRLMNANSASIMPQVIGAWCEQEGHDVQVVCYTGQQDLLNLFPRSVDLVFISAFTHAALTAYALSNRFRSLGVVTVLGGPHARCYPQDAQRYFDYVFGFTNKELIQEVLEDCSPHRPEGIYLTASGQPSELPGVRERWRFIEETLSGAPVLKMVPMVGSMGCPYTCAFCIDSEIPYQQMDFDTIKDDLRFLLTKFEKPFVGWHDPNFGVRFDEYMSAIEEAAPPGSITFAAESSLSLLSEDHVERLAKNGCVAILPGIESWYELGNKSRTGRRQGEEKVEQVADHVNMILNHIPYMQANFVLGMDCDEGAEPFELTKRFLYQAPGAFPAYSLLSAFGQAAPLNLDYQREGRVLPFPFHFLNNNHAMNVKPLNYSWPEFYDQVISLTAYSVSWRTMARRFQATPSASARWMNVLRAVSSEGFGRLRYFKEFRRLLDEDRHFRGYLEGEHTELPEFFTNQIKRDLGPLWEWLPTGAIHHDPNAYLKAHESEVEAEEIVPIAAAI